MYSTLPLRPVTFPWFYELVDGDDGWKKDQIQATIDVTDVYAQEYQIKPDPQLVSQEENENDL